MESRSRYSTGACTSAQRSPPSRSYASPPPSPSSHSPRPKGVLRQSGFHQPYPVDQFGREENLRRRSLQQDSSPSPGFDSHKKWGNVGPSRAARQYPHRSSLPAALPNTQPAHGQGLSPSETAPALASSPTSSNFPLPIALQRLKEADLETFKLARACGMTPDPVRISRPRKSFVVDEREALGRRGHRDRELGGSDHPASMDASAAQSRAHATQREKDSSPRAQSRPRSYTPSYSPTGTFSPASSQSTPQLSAPSIKHGSPITAYRPPPPFAPVHDPGKQLSRLEGLVKRHRDVWSAGRSSTGYLTLAALIDVDRLLHEHDIDAQVEEMRVEMERKVDGMSFRERSDKEKKGTRWRKPMVMVEASEPGYHVFGQPLSLTRMYASCVCSMAEFQHDLPIVVFACVEELYRTGMTVSGLFRTPPDRTRHSELIELFDHGPTFGRSLTLAKESTADICALLRSYIDRLPRAVWHESLFGAMWTLCVLPSVKREAQLAEESERDEITAGTGTPRSRNARPTSLVIPRQTGFDPGSGSNLHRTRSMSLNIPVLADGGDGAVRAACIELSEHELVRERTQLAAARALFRLLPRAQLALLAYLCAFFTQLPLAPQNQLGIEDVARLFAAPLFLGKPHALGGVVPATGAVWAARKNEARTMMVWILRRWAHISDGLFDAAGDADADGDGEDVREAEDVSGSASSSSDTDSVYSQLSMYAWPAGSGSSAAESSPERPDPFGPLDPARSPPLALAADLSQEDGSTQRRKFDLVMPGSPGKEDADLHIWKSLMEKDIDELRRALVDVRTRLDRQPPLA